MKNEDDILAPVATISRHRINIDGKGISTLVTFYGCPLRCQYCLNDYMQQVPDNVKQISIAELNKRTEKDYLYYLATGGGVTFGGGEPALRSRFIVAFKQKCAQDYNVRIETSLYVPEEHIKNLIPFIDEWIIDIKSLNEGTYQQYTQGFLSVAYTNLVLLAKQINPKKILIRLPLIDNYNTEEDRKQSIVKLKQLGLYRFDLFTYKHYRQ